ncbi:MAG: HYR domain-containing protein [Phycisphaerales bacterium]
MPSQARAGGPIVAWGENSDGQCNVPAPNADFIAAAGGGFHSLGLKSDGSIVAWGRNDFGQCNVPAPNTEFVAIAAGLNHSLGLKSDGSIVAWGSNDQGQCNLPLPNTGFVAVAAGWYHSMALTTGGSIATWGWCLAGQCNVSPPNVGFVAIAAGGQHNLGVRSDGSVAAWGSNLFHQCTVPPPNTGFIAVAGGGSHSLGLKSDGSIVAWGEADPPPLPNADFVAVAAGFDHSLGLKSDGSIVAWGAMAPPPAPNAGFAACAAGFEHSLGVKAPAEPSSLTLECTSCDDDSNPESTGFQVSMGLWARHLDDPVNGYQAFLNYDTTRLGFRPDLSSYSNAVFDTHFTPIGSAEGPSGLLKLDGTTFQPGGPESTTADTLLATLVFDVSLECGTAETTLAFVPYLIFVSELSFDGAALSTALVDLTTTIVGDTTPPVITCPPSVTVPAAAGGCTAIVAPGTATAIDNLDPSPTIVCTRSDMLALGAPFPSGVTTVTCTATDDCGNSSMCAYTITVQPFNEVQVTVDLPGSSPATRCILFLAHDGCTTAAANNGTLTFIDHDSNPLTPVRATGTILVPCGAWTTLCAKDEQHTKWAVPPSPLIVSGTHYVATGVLTLKPGDNDNDGDVDINDATWLIGTFGDLASPGCDGTPRDGDFSNDGAIGTEDYSIISGEWLTFSSCPACPSPLHGPAPKTLDRRTSIATAELAPHLRRADLDHNGVFDWRDVAVFEQMHGLGPELSRRLQKTAP